MGAFGVRCSKTLVWTIGLLYDQWKDAFVLSVAFIETNMCFNTSLFISLQIKILVFALFVVDSIMLLMQAKSSGEFHHMIYV